MKKEKIRKEVNYAGSDSYKCNPFRTNGILALLLIMVLILVANLRQTKKINKKLTDTLQKADDYFQYILEEEEAEEEEEIPEIQTGRKKARKKHEKSRRCSAFTGRFDGIFLLKIKGLFARI